MSILSWSPLLQLGMLSLLRHRLLVLVSCFAAQISTVLADVTWDSPSKGDIYVPGDTLQASWTSPDEVISPSFTICTGAVANSTTAGNNSDCGTAVWPSVEQNGTDYSISLAIPNITGDGNYYLLMKDDRGTMYETPDFSLALANNASDANTTATSDTSQSVGTSITYITSHSSSAAAAIAIPLSLVAAILLGALILLLFRARRSRQYERDREKQLQIAREALRQSNMTFANATDLERAVWALSAHKAYGDAGTSFPHTLPPIGMGGTFTRPGLGAAVAAAALGISAFGWAHGAGATGPTAAPMTDAYTPAPMQRHATDSSARSASRPPSVHGYYEHAKFCRPTNWLDTDWRSSQQTFADESTQCSGPPQLPAIQIYDGSLSAQNDTPPPLPPKQLFSGRLDLHAPRAYTPPYGSSLLKSDLPLPPIPGTEVHSSFNVISEYMQASPALPQNKQLYSSDHMSEPSAPHVQARRIPPPTLMHSQSFPCLETLPEREENEKPLPLRPEDRVGIDLYDVVSDAVRR